MGMGEQILHGYKIAAASEIGVSLKSGKTKSEEIVALCEDMNENELRSLAELIKSRADNIHRKKTNEAWQKVIQAWQEYRSLAPCDSKFVTVEYDECRDLDFELFELMDSDIH